MGQFKPMVKMETTEPSVELKLKKGGSVGHKKMECKADGGMMAMPSAPMRGGLPARGGMAPAAAPMRPDMAARRRAMMARPVTTPPAGLGTPPAMKKGGAALFKGKESYKEELAEAKAIKSGKISPAEYAKGEKSEGKMATGGVAMAQGGFKKGGSIKKFAKGGGVEGNVSTTPAGVSNTTTGSVAKSNGGGFKSGGAAKKFAKGGAVQDDGKAVKMPQGSKRTPPPVSINQLSGTYKKGGSVRKMAEGGELVDLSKGAYDKALIDDDVAFAKKLRNIPSQLYRGAKDLMGFGAKAPGAVTKTKESVTVAPAK
jgi:hypothetical protein